MTDMIWANPVDAYDWASLLANDLLSYPHVEKIFLFGSLARGEATHSSDIDMIVIVDKNTAHKWQEFMSDLDPGDQYVNHGLYRLTAAETLIGKPLIEGWFNILDIFMFPLNWLERLDELQQLGHHDDPEFMCNIARDAVAYDPALKSFPMASSPRRDERLFRDSFAEQMLE